jgi:hypothetical protein
MNHTKLIYLITLILFSNSTKAQEMDSREKLKLGLKAGANYSKTYNSKTDEFRGDPKFGFAGGVFLSVPIGKYLGIQPEVLYSNKGFSGEGILFGSRYEFTRTTSYIDVPIQIALKPSEFITILAGPQYSYLINQKDVFSSSLVSYTQEEAFKNDNIRKNIFGFVAGVDFNINHLVVGTRIGWDITENHGNGSSGTPRYRNMWLQATLGYAF